VTPKDVWNSARIFLRNRRMAYLRIFNPESRDAQVVLADLATFCRAGKTTFEPDERLTAVLEGRRQVWLRINQHLKLDEETLWRLYDGRPEPIER
jgi:hypothetical protein